MTACGDLVLLPHLLLASSAAVLAAVLFLVVRILVVPVREDKTSGRVPPGTLGLPLIGETIQFLAAHNSNKGIYDFVQTRRLRYGDCFKTKIFGKTHVFISGTDSVKAILSNDFLKFTKQYIRSMAELVGNQSILCASQEQHPYIRGKLSHLFSSESMSVFIRHFDNLMVNSLNNWEHRGVVVVLQDALQITFNGMCKILMSLENSNELQMLQDDVAQICEAMLAFPMKLPCTRFYKGLMARKRVMATLSKLIDIRRRGSGQNHNDFMQSLLVEENCSDSSRMLTDTQIKDNILTLIIAGQVTTASAMTWMVKYLDENQHIQDTLRKQQQIIASKGHQGSYLLLEDLNGMTLASTVIKESLRLASIVAWLPRIALKDCEIEGFKIKKGWIVNIDTKATHLDPILYNNPTKFDPSRFNDDFKPYSFLAFGTGGRTCLGMNLAKIMIIVFLHRLITTYRWKVVDPDNNLEKRALFSRLRSGCPVQVTPLPSQ